MRLFGLLACLTLTLGFAAFAFQDGPGISDAPPPGLAEPHAVLSPTEKTTLKVGKGKITVIYGSPAMRHRKIFGELVPYGQIWRAGADNATLLQTDFDLDLPGLHIPKGSYSLFVWVDPKQWQLVVNKQTGQSGLDHDAARDLGRVPMQMSTVDKALEHLRITLSGAEKGSDNARLTIAWENTAASVDFKIKLP